MKSVRNYALVFVSVSCFLWSSLLVHAVEAEPDSLIFENYVKTISPDAHLPVNELIVKTGLYFLNRPYVGGTLEQNGDEQLVVNLRELDCTTFVENCVALSLLMKSADKSFGHYKSVLQTLRYRDGMVNGYSSRLHYSSDWIFENERKGFWKNISLSLGGLSEEKTINFMSANSRLYPAIKDDSSMKNKIEECENALNLRKNYVILPKEQIASQEKNFRDGDIVFFGTKINGLDFSHVGIAYRNNGVLSFIHASSAGKKVMVQPTSLADYCLRSKNCNGIAVVRLNEMKK
ncbi:MAG: hypothetical protein H6Q14_2563 [Bacteroidetes bacterium]|nr:hypothetical protein [Bacteroidota bacterium]